MAAGARSGLTITADAREVKQAADVIRKAFDPRHLQGFQRAAKQVTGTIEDFVKHQKTINKELGEIRAGTRAYQSFRRELREVNREARRLRDTLAQINQQGGGGPGGGGPGGPRPPGPGGGGGGAGGPRRTFVAGLAQGLGVADYMPDDPRMMRRIGGAMLGRGLRRGMGAGWAPFAMPGMGGMAQSLQAIPIVGTAAAGGLQTLAGAYSEAVGWSKARLQNIHMEAGIVPRALAGAQARYRQAIVEAPTIARLHAASVKARGDVATTERRATTSMVTEGDKGAIGRAATTMIKATGVPAGQARTLSGVAQGALPGMLRKAFKILPGGLGEQVLKTAAAHEMDVMDVVSLGAYGTTAAARAVKKESAVLKASSDAQKAKVTQSSREAKLKEQMRAAKGRIWKAGAAAYRGAAGGPSELVSMPMGWGTGFGMDPTMAEQFSGQFMGARGGGLTRKSRLETYLAASAQTLFGAGAQMTGGFGRMFRPGRGGMLPEGAQSGGMQVLLNILNQAAWGTGKKQGAIGVLAPGADTNELLQELVGQGQRAEKQGIRFNPQSFAQVAHAIRAMAPEGVFGGSQGARVASGLNQFLQGVAGRGVQKPQDVLALKAFGYRPGQGIEAYFGARRRMEEAFGGGEGGTEGIFNLMADIAEGAAGGLGRAGPETRAGFAKGRMGAMGIPMSFAQASSFMKWYHTGPTSRAEKLKAFQDQMRVGSTDTSSGMWITAAKTAAQLRGGAAVGQAGLAARRVGLGLGAAGTIQSLERSSLKAAGVVLKFSGEITSAAKSVTEFYGEIGKAVDALRATFGSGGKPGTKPTP